MRTICLSLVFIFCCYSKGVFSQDSRFIEIISVDTVELKPLEFTYQLSLGDDFMYPSIVTVDDDKKKKTSVNLSTLTKALDKNNFQYTIEIRDYNISPNTKTDSVITLVFKNSEEIKRLQIALRGVEKVSGKIINIKYESLSTYKEQMYKSLYTKAYQDAVFIAGVTGNSIGKLISIQEVSTNSDFFSNYLEMYKKMMSSNKMFSEMFNMEKDFVQKIERKLAFRFEIK